MGRAALQHVQQSGRTFKDLPVRAFCLPNDTVQLFARGVIGHQVSVQALQFLLRKTQGVKRTNLSDTNKLCLQRENGGEYKNTKRVRTRFSSARASPSNTCARPRSCMYLFPLYFPLCEYLFLLQLHDLPVQAIPLEPHALHRPAEGLVRTS